MIRYSVVLLSLLAVNAYATNYPPPPDPAPTATADADAVAVAGAAAGAYAHGGDGGEASATGGSATATSGDSSAEGGDASADNSLNLNQTYKQVRQAPSVSQGSLVIGSCGAGGNGGGSNSHGAAFLGLSWTPKHCKLLLAAAAYQAMGMNDAACSMINGISSVQKRWKELGMEAPSCEVKPSPVVEAPPPVDMSKYVTDEELAARWDAISKEMAEREKRMMGVLSEK